MKVTAKNLWRGGGDDLVTSDGTAVACLGLLDQRFDIPCEAAKPANTTSQFITTKNRE